MVADGVQRFAVNERSGCLDLSDRISKHALARNHFNMNKFARPGEEDYQVVVEQIQKVMEHTRVPPVAPPVSTDKAV